MGAAVVVAGPVVARPQAIDAASSNVSAPAVNTAAAITFAATPGVKHVLGQFFTSYSGGDPTGGRVSVTDAGVVVFDEDISYRGPAPWTLIRPLRSAVANTAMVVTLAAGGAAVTGKLNTPGKWTE